MSAPRTLPRFTPVPQTTFGLFDGPVEDVGNCFPACVASLLGLAIADVPHFYQQASGEDARIAITRWCRERDWALVPFEWAPWLTRLLSGALVIVSGRSPRGDHDHAVIGQIDDHGWKMVHDPHPSRAGIASAPTLIEVLVPLRAGGGA